MEIFAAGSADGFDIDLMQSLKHAKLNVTSNLLWGCFVSPAQSCPFQLLTRDLTLLSECPIHICCGDCHFRDTQRGSLGDDRWDCCSRQQVAAC